MCLVGTLVKFTVNKAKVLSASDRAQVPLKQIPDRSPDVVKGHLARAWMEGAEWFYGGVGFAGKNSARAGGGCDCHNARFAFDYFARSFVPEIDHYSVAVLDAAGNLILRIGRYGNVDDGAPLMAERALRKGVGDPSERSPTPSEKTRIPRSIGGDEVALFYAPYVATHTDRRLFIADPGNARIVSVRLGYHATARVNLKDVKDERP